MLCYHFFLFINISITPLFKSALTIMFPCVSIFSTPIFNHISLNILNVLLTFLWPTSFIAVLLRISICILSCYNFLSMGCTTTLQSYHSFFFSVLYSGYKISLFFHSNTFSFIVFFLSYFIHYTLVISLFFASFSL